MTPNSSKRVGVEGDVRLWPHSGKHGPSRDLVLGARGGRVIATARHLENSSPHCPMARSLIKLLALLEDSQEHS